MERTTWPDIAARSAVVRLLPARLASADQADLGLVSYPEGGKELKVIPWRQEKITVAAAPSHPLSRRPVLTPADLNGQDYIGFDEDLSIRQALDRFFREHDIAINMAMQFDNIQMIKEA